jgi:hypothetical protein
MSFSACLLSEVKVSFHQAFEVDLEFDSRLDELLTRADFNPHRLV